MCVCGASTVLYEPSIVCVLVFSACVCVSPCCQDESSLGNNLSRCIVFRQGALISVRVCVVQN